MTKPFKIGLTMAGAISAGAYTAGVLDFLLEALAQWDAAKAGGLPPDPRGVPAHSVEISVVSGASAGSICAALFAAIVGRRHTPMSRDTPPVRGANKLYDTWVRDARIEGLLESNDFSGDDPVIASALDSSYLTRMARAALVIRPPYEKPNYVADPLEIMLTTGNLRGVVYGISFTGEETDGHDMVRHGDWQHFYLSASKNCDLEKFKITRLDPNCDDAAWSTQLCDSALASSAFPIGLAARVVKTPALYYGRRRWALPGGAAADPKPKPDSFAYATWFSEAPIPPRAPDSTRDSDFDYVSVDGGTYNNEPFELARRALAGDEYRNNREGGNADRAVLMVDPFPDPVDIKAPYAPMIDLPSVAKSLLGAFVQQARFKPEELALAAAPGIFSRFLIAPIAEGPTDDSSSTPAMASACLSGFGGFLSEAFRHHDFQLGRRNCQRFLQRHFALYPENPIFNSGADPGDAYNFTDIDSAGMAGATRSFRPIIPLLGTAQDEVPHPAPVKMSPSELDVLEPLIGERLETLVGKARSIYARPRIARVASWIGWRLFRGAARTKIMSAIRGDLQARGLL